MTDEEFRDRLIVALKDPTILLQLHTIIMAATKDIRK